MNEIKYSILIAAYNAEKYLKECIESVLIQNYTNYEVIIINDGSTDATLDICKKYEKKDKRIKVFSWENHGLVLARRKGIEMSKGEYILFLDADDMYKQDALSVIEKEIINNPDVAIFGFEFLFESGKIQMADKIKSKQFISSSKTELFYDFINNYQYNHMWSKVIKRELILKDDFDYEQFKNIKLGEDLLQSIQIYGKAQNVIISEKSIYLYRVLDKSMSHGFCEQHITDISKVYNVLYEYLKKQKWETSICINALYKQYSLKTSNILRTLWMENTSLEYKMKISEKIKNINIEMIDTRKMDMKNRIIWILSDKEMWNLCNMYSLILKKISRVKKYVS